MTKIALIVVFVVITLHGISTETLVSFEIPEYVVEETDGLVSLTLELSNSSHIETGFTCFLSPNASSDFFHPSVPGVFPPNTTISTCEFFVKDDVIPEGNETFPVSVKIRNNKAIGATGAVIKILLNDNPHGFVGFTSPGEVTVEEPTQHNTTSVLFNLTRYGGNIGDIELPWAVIQQADADIQPSNGTIHFKDGQSHQSLHINILADELPEQSETFTIRLIGTFYILSNQSEVGIRILENDTPLRFREGMVTFNEPEKKEIVVYRGLSVNELRIGPISEETTVYYETVGGTALSGVDYVPQKGKIVFERDTTTKTISIEVLKDPNPEFSERFSVRLYNATSNIVLIEPHVLEVVIAKNDDPNGVISFNTTHLMNGTVVMNEKDEREYNVPIMRTMGIIGNIFVCWEIVNANRSSSFTPFLQTTGVVILADGNRSSEVTLQIKDDNLPSEVAFFTLHLHNVSGGARLKEVNGKSPVVRVVVADSDDGYGVVSFVDQPTKLILSTTPRRFDIMVERTGGSFGTVDVTYRIQYFERGQSRPTNSPLEKDGGVVTFNPSVKMRRIAGEIRNDVFLKAQSYFVVTLEKVSLREVTMVQTSSPIFGMLTNQFVNISTEQANGEIGFFNVPVRRSVTEPINGLHRVVELRLMRDGTSEEAVVFWNVNSSNDFFTDNDIQTHSGKVTFGKGVRSATIQLKINADDIPELDEIFTVQLVNMSGKNERLRNGATSASITILQNDDPGGVFEFADGGHVFILENSSFTMDVVRTGGSLIQQFVDVYINNGREDFESLPLRLKFGVNVTSKQALIYPKEDGIPEMNETFDVVLSPAKEATLGNITTFKLTIIANEDPHGLVSFSRNPSNLNQQINEAKGKESTLTFQLSRQNGLFGRIAAHWRVSSVTDNIDTSQQLHPTSGWVTMAEGQNSTSITLNVLNDQLPEGNQLFQVTLDNITGGAHLLSPIRANLTIMANDFPVTLSPGDVSAKEGETVKLTVGVNSPLPQNIDVSLEFETGNASSDDFVLVQNSVMLPAGRRTMSVEVKLVDDSVAELQECFMVNLTSTTGDSVLQHNTSSIVCIEPNDNPGGVFVFKDAQISDAKEGEWLNIRILREKGAFGEAQVQWRAAYLNGSVVDSGELSNVSGIVLFGNAEKHASLSVNVLRDGAAELGETFVFSLYNASGEHTGAVIGSPSDVHVTVLSNDYPNGLFVIDQMFSSRVFAEDYDRNHGDDDTIGKVYFNRTMGDWFNATILWEIVPSGGERNLIDVLAHGVANSTSGMIETDDDQAFVFEFSNESCVNFSKITKWNGNQSGGFSLRFWLKANNVTSTSPKNLLDMRWGQDEGTEISIHDRMLTFKTSKSKSVISLVSATFYDDSWHDVIFSMTSTGKQFVYVDGERSGEGMINASLVPGTPDHIVVGCFGGNNFIGFVKNVRLYEHSLNESNVVALKNLSRTFNQTSGYLTFHKGDIVKSINIATVDDSIPEAELPFIIRIADVIDDRRFEREKAAIDKNKENLKIKVLKSDLVNGIFQLFTNDCSLVLEEHDTERWMMVQRTHSFVGRVELHWVIVNSNGDSSTTDFIAANGSVVFMTHETYKNISIKPLDDSSPEINESFVFKLDSAIPIDGKVQSSGHSGATVMKSHSRCNITILSNDNPRGVLQLMLFVPSVKGFIPMRKDPGIVKVVEESGTLHLNVVRAQGTKGTVSVEWETVSGTAEGGKDFKMDVGSVTFRDGEKSARIQVQLVDNKVAELTKTFRVVLRNPRGGASVTDNSDIIVHIKPSDGALGIFRVTYRKVFTEEGSIVNITVLRLHGSMGNASVSWRIQNGSHDFVKSTGVIHFGKGVDAANVTLTVLDDKISEEEESFLFSLVNTTGGVISQSNSTRIVISSSDNPYGLFEFEFSSTTVEESDTNKTMRIMRRKGERRHVRVYYEAVSLADHGNRVMAVEGVDYEGVKAFVDFMEGETEKLINVRIMQDDEPEIDERFGVNITRIQVLRLNSSVTLESMIGTPSTIIVTILKNGNVNGIVGLTQSTINITEDHVGTILNVTRKAGTFGKISLSFGVIENTSEIGVDFFVTNYTITMEEGETVAALPLFMINDGIPELEESFVVMLLSDSVTGGVILGEFLSCRVNILQSDHPYGVIGFKRSKTIVVNEPEEKSVGVLVTLSRDWGTMGIVKIGWRISPATMTADVAWFQDEVGFLSGEREKNVSVYIVADELPELNEMLTLQLLNVTQGLASIDPLKDRLSIVILENDNPFGIVFFETESESVLADEGNSTSIISLNVARRGGMFGDVHVFYETLELSSSTSLTEHRAISNKDFRKETDSMVVIRNGTRNATIDISIYNDDIAELAETFQVAITKVSVGDTGQQNLMIGDRRIVNVTIQENDHANGLFRMSLDSSSSSPRRDELLIREPDERSIPVEMHIDRHFGLFGVVTVSWKVVSGYTIIPELDTTGPVNDTVTFLATERRKSFTLFVNNDTIPEDDEEFSIQLYRATGGAGIDESHDTVRVVIRANDNAGGIIGFREGSLSRTVQEGDTFDMYVQRTPPALGGALVAWALQGKNVTQDFKKTHGLVEFQESQVLTIIRITANIDSVPETSEGFTLQLTIVNSSGIDPSGAAVLDPSAVQASILIGASNNPHGILQFYDVIDGHVRVTESDGEVSIRVVREFGKLGALELFYQIERPFANSTFASATIGEDIPTSGASSILISDGADSVKITIPIINDQIPEVNEAFIVRLVSVKLSSALNSTLPPMIGARDRITVVIEANDGANGVLSFDKQSINPSVEEGESFNLTVTRSLGTFGQVYCFYFLNQLSVSKSDMYISGGVMNGGPAKLVFLDGQQTANITIFITNDNETEDVEQFEVGITNQNAIGNGGVRVERPDRTLVSIMSNDDAHGVVQFRKNSRHVILREPNTTAESGLHEFTVERLAGVFGSITVAWHVVSISLNNSSTIADVRPLSGVLTFDAYDHERIFRLHVIDDDVPELDKKFEIRLSVVQGGARLGEYPIATIMIPANDDPHGVFSFSKSVIFVEESKTLIQVSVVREAGLYGDVTVDYETHDVTAQSMPGNVSTVAVESIYNVSKFQCSHSFVLAGKSYLIVIANNRSMLYVWKGVFLKIKDMLFTNAEMIKSIVYTSETFTNNNSQNNINNSTQSLLMAASNTTHLSIYTFHQNATLLHLQTILMYGVTDMALVVLSGRLHLIVTVGVSRIGNTMNKLKMFEWKQKRFQEIPSLYQTFHGKTLDIMRDERGNIFLAVGNYFHVIRDTHETQSMIYKWSAMRREFQLYGEVKTNGVLSIDFFTIQKEIFISVANERGRCAVYTHDPNVAGRFKKLQTFASNCESMRTFTQNDADYLVIVSATTTLYQFDRHTKIFDKHLIIPYDDIIYYDVIRTNHMSTDTTLERPLFLVHQKNSPSFMLAYLCNISSTSDYLFRNGRLFFDEDQRMLSFYITMFKDTVPEDDESFRIELSNPTHGARVSPTKGSLEVVLMANDNAYGRIEFANSSLDVRIVEKDHDTVIRVVLLREFGTNRDVTVMYNVTKTHGDDTENEVYPSHGQLTIKAGQKSQTLLLYLTGDTIPEIVEKFQITLTNIQTQGLVEGGATFNHLRRTSELFVMPNDDAYGLFEWSSTLFVTTEENERNSSALLVVKRAGGRYGMVIVSYETVLADQVGMKERAARSGIDFIAVQANVTIAGGRDEAFVSVPIMHKSMEVDYNDDKNADYNEIFYVNITSVVLLDVDKSVSSYSPPRINPTKRSVQVVITEVIQNNGIIEFSLTNDSIMTVDENAGTFSVPVVRHNGSDGYVGIYFNVIYKTADSHDVSPSSGTVSFATNETTQSILISVIDDDIPELTESLVVQLTKPVGGAAVGVRNLFTIVIKENDYPYGLFGIHSNSSKVFAEEGETVNIMVERKYGSQAAMINVVWSCNKSLDDDISQVSGKLQFKKGEFIKTIQFIVIDDDQPEVEEQVTCVLDTVSPPAVLSDRREAIVVIRASDKPHGEYMIDQNSRDFIVREPMAMTSQDGKFQIRVLRSAGQQGRSTVSWKIVALDGHHGDNDTVRTFDKTSGVVLFDDTVKESFIAIQVLDDTIPEESRRYRFLLHSPTSGAALSPNGNSTIITVASSDNPYGLFSLNARQHPVVLHEMQAQHFNVIVQRQGGLIGDIEITYVAHGDENKGDIFPDGGKFIFRQNSGIVTLEFNVTDDDIPELDETFTVRLLSAKLLHRADIDFSRTKQVNVPPLIVEKSALNVTILQNDYPHGLIEFQMDRITCHEWQSRVRVPVVRRGGTFGSVRLSFSYTPIEAKPFVDFNITQSTVSFGDGVNMSYIDVTIMDDTLPEEQESFTIYLQTVTDGGAAISNKSHVTVVIETSDNPFGVFGIYNITPSQIVIQNPLTNRILNLPITRLAGSTGDIKVSWFIQRTVNSSSFVSEDLAPSDGVVSFSDGQSDTVVVQVQALPYGGPQEGEERFQFVLKTVTGGAAIDKSASKVSIIIKKKGYPNGLFYISGVIEPSSVVNEPRDGQNETVVRVHVRRRFGRLATVNVHWTVTSSNGDVSADLRFNQSQTIVFLENELTSYIYIYVLNDNQPELTETFEVKLLSASSDGEVDESQDRISFNIRENDEPFGVFYLPLNEQTFHLDTNTLERSLHLSVARRKGAFGSCMVNIIVTYPELSIIQRDVEFVAMETRQTLAITIAEDVFLKSATSFTVRITSVVLKNPTGMSSGPNWDKDMSIRMIDIPEIGSNSVVEVTPDSRLVLMDVITKQTTVTVTRTGLYGNISVSWKRGYPDTMINKPSISTGTLSPNEGVVTIEHGSRTGTLSISAILPDVIDESYDYVVHLTPALQPVKYQKGWPQLGTNIYSILEPHGVIEISTSYRNIIALEGSTAVIDIVRFYSTLGTIRVNYQTKIHTGSNAAIPNEDFLPVTSSIDFLIGEFEKRISIKLLDDTTNPKPEFDKFFIVELLSVEVLSANLNKGSPRFGSSTVSIVTIQDNDNPFGTLSFTPRSRTVNVGENAGFVELTVQRTGGAFSETSVEILTLGGGEPWLNEILSRLPDNSEIATKLKEVKRPASSQTDYVPFRRNIPFVKQTTTSAQQQLVKINLYVDDVAEPPEEFFVLIFNATGGAIIFAPHSYAVVTINANGLYNGMVRFESSDTATIDEDGEEMLQLVIMREGSLSEQILVSWIATSETMKLDEQLESVRGVVNITAGSSTAIITLRAIQDVTPEITTWFLVNLTSVSSGAILQKDKSFLNVTLLESDYPFGQLAFDVTSRYPVVDLSENEVELVVRRFNGSMNSIQVGYSTRPIPGVTRDGGILLNPAIERSDFVPVDGVLDFNEGQTKSYIKVKLLFDQSSTTTSYPKIFNVTLEKPSVGAVLSPSYKSSRVVISNKPSAQKFLKLRSDLLSVPLNDAKIVELLTSLSNDVQTELTEDEHHLSRTTIEAIINYKNDQERRRSLQPEAIDLMLNIFNNLMSTSRKDTSGHSYWMSLFEKAAFALTNDFACPTRSTFERSNFVLTVERTNKSKLNDAKFGDGENYFRYPSNMYATDGSGGEDRACTDVQFVEMKNAQWFSGENSVLNNKVLSSSVRSGSVDASKKIVFRIQAPQNRITPTGVSCVIWDHLLSLSAQGAWSSKNCKIRTEEKDYVECECDHMSEYAVLARSDDRTGYEIYFFVVCFVTIGACFLALVSHYLCSVDKTFPSKLLMHMFFAVMLSNIIYVIGAYLSPRLTTQVERCSVLAIFLHFSFLAQFTTMFVQACNLWKILILNDEHSDRKALPLYIAAWGLPAIIIIGYFFITHAVWDWNLTMMYGDVHGNGDLCFIPHAYAAFSVAVIPVLLFVLAVGVVFVQAYQVTPQWKCYDDIYRGRYNIKEVRHLMILFSMVALTWLFGGLHIAYGHLWMAIAFTFFNGFTGLDIFIVYVILRNQMRYVFRGKYDINNQAAFDGMELPHFMYQPANSTTKEVDEVDMQSGMDVNHEQKIRRSATPMSVQRSPYIERQATTTSNFRRRVENADERPTSRNIGGIMNSSYDDNSGHDEMESADFDDLIFALKSGGNFSPSIHEDVLSTNIHGDDEENDELNQMFPEPPPPLSERYSSVRRIRMGDTPL